MHFEEYFFMNFIILADEIVTENKRNVDWSSLQLARFAFLKPYNQQLNNLVFSGFTIKFQNSGWKYLFMDLAKRLGS